MAPPADIPKVSAAAPSVTPSAARDAAGGQGGAAATRAPSLDLADIRPLDVSGALQILIAEVRAALDEALLSALRTPAPAAASSPLPALAASAQAAADTPEQAAHAVLETLLQALPESVPDTPQLAQAQSAVNSAIQSGMQRAIDIVGGWQGVAAAAPDVAHAAAQLIANALGEEALNGAWLRPEWSQFLPRLERFRRRRSRLRRRLTDPDYRDGEFEDDERR